MNLIVNYLTRNDCFKEGRVMFVKGITVHSTGCNNPNVNRYVDIEGCSKLNWNRPGLTKCVHAFIGKMPDGRIGTCQTLPWNARGWHIGPGKYGSYNNGWIGFEVCEDDLMHREYFNAVLKEAIELCAMLCKKFNLDPLEPHVIVSHHEGYLDGMGSNHADIDHWFKRMNYSMDQFRQAVSEYINNENTEEEEQMTQDKFYEMFEVALKTYQEKMSKEVYSNWAKKEEVPEWIAETGISDGTMPQIWPTREQVWAMLKRFDHTI